ncbi:hypothetical protein RUM43_000365 [Polyplax serrata]|uniref:Uncharacterized protein n=1 Tax=Polyplax serrata TaxID=468196 RepID=A0AAN8SD95_POLSC
MIDELDFACIFWPQQKYVNLVNWPYPFPSHAREENPGWARAPFNVTRVWCHVQSVPFPGGYFRGKRKPEALKTNPRAPGSISVFALVQRKKESRMSLPICRVIKARQFFLFPSREIQTVEMSRRPFAIISSPDYLDFDISPYLEIKQKEKVNAECYCSYSGRLRNNDYQKKKKKKTGGIQK